MTVWCEPGAPTQDRELRLPSRVDRRAERSILLLAQNVCIGRNCLNAPERGYPLDVSAKSAPEPLARPAPVSEPLLLAFAIWGYASLFGFTAMILFSVVEQIMAPASVPIVLQAGLAVALGGVAVACSRPLVDAANSLL